MMRYVICFVVLVGCAGSEAQMASIQSGGGIEGEGGHAGAMTSKADAGTKADTMTGSLGGAGGAELPVDAQVPVGMGGEMAGVGGSMADASPPADMMAATGGMMADAMPEPADMMASADKPPVPFELNINFQPAGGAPPTGYDAVDSGQVFGARGGGKIYGWNAPHSCYRRNTPGALSENDTVCYFHAGGKWEISLREGAYYVFVNVGDSAQPTNNTINVQGTNLFNGLVLAKNKFKGGGVRVSITSGRLTIDSGFAPEGTTGINYVAISNQL
jgi:hypothetical protein